MILSWQSDSMWAVRIMFRGLVSECWNQSVISYVKLVQPEQEVSCLDGWYLTRQLSPQELLISYYGAVIWGDICYDIWYESKNLVTRCGRVVVCLLGDEYHSSSRSQTSSVTIQNLLYQRYTFVLALTITSCIILLKDTLLLSSYSPLRIWWLRAVSTYGSLANCWQTQSVHIIKMIPLLIIHMCGHICIFQHIHLLTILVEVNRVNWISLGLTYRE